VDIYYKVLVYAIMEAEIPQNRRSQKNLWCNSNIKEPEMGWR
jgi:hypothetical protein